MAAVTSAPITSGTTFAQLQSAGLTGIINKLVTANPAIANPSTAPTVAVTGGGSTGGLLAAGAYFVSYTWANGFGETTAKEVASAFTVAAGNIPQVTIPALPTGATSANIYLSPVGGASGTETLYAAGVTATTANLATARIAGLGAAPTANDTALSNHVGVLNAGIHGRLQDVYYDLYNHTDNFLRGEPVDYAYAFRRFSKLAAIFHALAEAADEVVTLVDANKGTLTTVANQVGLRKPVRTFP